MNVITAAKVGAYAIAAAAAGMSYGHQKALYLANGLGGYSYVVPIVVDLLALLAAAVRNADAVPTGLKRTATWTLAAAGLGSVAANVAVAENAVQVAVGIGTVAAYLLAENFVSALKRAQAAKAKAETPTVEVADLIAEAERVTRQAVAAEMAAQLEVERAAMAAQMATASAKTRPATVATVRG